jgi:predicted permease
MVAPQVSKSPKFPEWLLLASEGGLPRGFVDNLAIVSDLRFAVRLLLRSPAFSTIAVLLLAVGIGANAVFFSAFDHILLRPLPVRNPEELVRVVHDFPGIGIRGGTFPAYYEALRKNATTLSTVFGSLEMNSVISEPAEQIRVHLVTSHFFDAMGVPPVYGRVLTEADEAAREGLPPAVLSAGLWRRRFHEAPDAVGWTISLNGHRFVVVGVMPRQFNGFSTETSPDVRVPLRAFPLLAGEGETYTRSWMEVAARLKPGVSAAQAQAEAAAIWKSAMGEFFQGLPYYQSHPTAIQEDVNQGVQLESLEHGISILRTRFGSALRFLAAAALVLQLIVCANLAGLLLARNAGRARDTAVRLAVGASRGSLMPQMLAESLLLTVAGACGGIFLAYAGAPLLVRSLPPLRDLATTPMTVSLDLRPDWRVLAFSLGISAITVMLTGIGPAISASRVSLDLILRGARFGGSWRGRQALLVFQIALCTVLLAGAGLLIRTFQQLNHTNPGFQPEHLASFTTAPSLSGYKGDQVNALRLALMSRVRQIPGVAAVATASRPIMRGSGLKTTVAPAGQRITKADALNTTFAPVSPEYFNVMGMTVISGRALLGSDQTKARPFKAVVNEAFVRRVFGGANPLGRRFGGGADNVALGDYEVVGVAADTKFRSLREPMAPTYFSLETPGDFTLYVRTWGAPEDLIQPARKALSSLDPALPFTEIHTMREEIEASTAPERLTSALAAAFSLTAALLASVGIYGLFAVAVVQRRREIGIRMAVGAQPGEIARMFGAQAMLTAALGIALGTGAALLLAPVAASLLYGVSPLDAPSFTFAAVFMALAAVTATMLPATRAALVRPAEALRSE